MPEAVVAWGMKAHKLDFPFSAHVPMCAHTDLHADDELAKSECGTPLSLQL